MTRILKLNNNQLSSLAGIDTVLPTLMIEPFALTLLDLSFNNIEKIEKVRVPVSLQPNHCTSIARLSSGGDLFLLIVAPHWVFVKRLLNVGICPFVSRSLTSCLGRLVHCRFYCSSNLCRCCTCTATLFRASRVWTF